MSPAYLDWKFPPRMSKTDAFKTVLAKAELLSRKGVFPYEWFTDEDKLKLDSLPPKEDFHSKIRCEGISDEDYAHAQKVWTVFECKTFADYARLYIISDTLLLADCFESHRKQTFADNGIDLSHFITKNSYNWHSLLKTNPAGVQLLTDPDMYRWWESSIRGGLSVAIHRHAKVERPGDKIMDLDMCSLYAWAMQQALPVGGYAWQPLVWVKKHSTKEAILRLDDGSKPTHTASGAEYSDGYEFQISGHWPKELHDKFAEFPLLPETRTVSADEMSPKQRELFGGSGIEASVKSKKLIADLLPKRNYILHYRMLQFVLRHGFVLEKVHRVMRFKQRPWMASYVNDHAEKRAATDNELLRKHHKSAMVGGFGKCIENVRNRKSIKVVHDKESILRCTADARRTRFIPFSNDVGGFVMRKSTVKLNKPIPVGSAILDLAKLRVAEFHYETIKPVFGDRAKLMMHDTDSFMYKFEQMTDDDLAKISHMLDMTTVVPKGHPLWSDRNAGVPGFPKDDAKCLKNGPIEEFVALRSKLYSFQFATGETDGRAKGITEAVRRRDLKHDKYLVCLTGQRASVWQHTIRSDNHTVKTTVQNRLALDGLDTKRFLLADGISTLPHGHYLTGVERTVPPIDQTEYDDKAIAREELIESGSQSHQARELRAERAKQAHMATLASRPSSVAT